MDKNIKNKNQKHVAQANPLESLKDIANSATKQMKQEVGRMPQDFIDHLFGTNLQESFSGEIIPGESVEIKDIYSGRQEEIVITKKQTTFERRLLEEERIRVEKKTNELKIQLSLIQREIVSLIEKTEGLAEETEIAAMQAPVEPGIYHMVFFEKLREFIQSFNKKIGEARVWLQSVNRRTAKKNAWGANYKKHGAKYLLSSEHYLSRSAG